MSGEKTTKSTRGRKSFAEYAVDYIIFVMLPPLVVVSEFYVFSSRRGDFAAISVGSIQIRADYIRERFATWRCDSPGARLRELQQQHRETPRPPPPPPPAEEEEEPAELDSGPFKIGLAPVPDISDFSEFTDAQLAEMGAVADARTARLRRREQRRLELIAERKARFERETGAILRDDSVFDY